MHPTGRGGPVAGPEAPPTPAALGSWQVAPRATTPRGLGLCVPPPPGLWRGCGRLERAPGRGARGPGRSRAPPTLPRPGARSLRPRRPAPLGTPPKPRGQGAFAAAARARRGRGLCKSEDCKEWNVNNHKKTSASDFISSETQQKS